MHPLAAAIALVVLTTAACHKVGPENPRVRTDAHELNLLRAELRDNPVSLRRPVVVITGLWDPGVGDADIAATLAQLTSGRPDDFIRFQPGVPQNFDESIIELTELINERLNDGRPALVTPEVDVVALSMGGLVARHATIPSVRWITLDAARVFTLASPHTGARFAEDWHWLDPIIADMAPGSDYLAWLDRNDPRDYRLFPYAVTNDPVVGKEYAAPSDWEQDPLWVRGRFHSSHQFIHRDEILLTDIALRLRGETPLFVDAAPTPDRRSETRRRRNETTRP